MSADNMLVILKMDDGRYGVYHVMMPQIENYYYFLDVYNMDKEDFPFEEYPWKNPEENIRSHTPSGIYKTLQEANLAAHKMCAEDIIEYGVEIWCPYKVVEDD